jgi:hypothetical protein
MTAPDPAGTFSGNLPSLPPVPRDDGGELTVLDPRFPIRVKEPARIFWQQVSEWPDRETVIGQTIRATQQHTTVEERFVQPLHVTAPIPAIAATIATPIIHPELGEAALADDWEMGPGTAILAAPELPRRHSHRGRGGRFISRAAS